MKDVDYVKLSEQYAGFLVAVGGISITVLTLVLSVGSKLTEGASGPFLVLALVVATVCCFVGAHMMAETAAFISYSKERLKNAMPRKIKSRRVKRLGEHLFVLASINIFIAVALVSFALMLLSLASHLKASHSFKWISFLIFIIVVAGASYWVFLAAFHRTPVDGTFRDPGKSKTKVAVKLAIGVFLFWTAFLWLVKLLVDATENDWLLAGTFIPIVLITGVTLVCFVRCLKDSQEAPNRNLSFRLVVFFGASISLSYACLVFAGIRAMLGE